MVLSFKKHALPVPDDIKNYEEKKNVEKKVDLSFPAALKQYFEQINVLGITFVYTPEGTPKGLCRAKRLYYVTTAGGPIFSEEYGYGYVKALAQGFYGIEETKIFKAEGLDIVGANVEGILDVAKREIERVKKNRP